MFEFLEYLASGKLTEGEAELAYNLTVIYGLSILSMVVLYKLMNPSNVGQTNASSNNVSCSLPSSHSTLKLIKSRRSIMPKDLTGEHLNKSDIDLVLDAANWAPTHHKTEPWRYTVIDSADGILDYLDMMDCWYSENKESLPEEEYNRFSAKITSVREVWPQKVSHMIIICMKRQALPDKKLPEWEEISAVACSVQNMHLALTSLEGVGGFWSSHTWCKAFRDSKEMRNYLDLSDDEDRVFGAFLIGKVQEGKQFRSKRGDWEDKVTWK